MSTKKRVAVVGAGISGLAAIKSCLEEDLEPTCFEQYESVGGIWYYTEEYREGQGASAFDNLTINVNKEMFAYSDFPFPQEQSSHPTAKDVHEYLVSYSTKFELDKYTRLFTKVTNIARSHDYDVTGKWDVETVTKDGSPKREVFDFVMVCSGFYKKPFKPDVEGMETFKGDVEHSALYRHAEKYKDKRVLLVGNGNSSLDIAVGSAAFAEKILYSVGPGMWVLPRILKDGIPYDNAMFTRANFRSKAILDQLLYNICNDHWDVDRAGHYPSTVPTRSRLAVNDGLDFYIMNGKIKIYNRLVRLGPREAEFDDGSVVKDIDAVLFATGYQISLDFLKEDIIEENGKLSLYKLVFPLRLPHNTLALVGCQEVLASNPPVLELQCRLAARVFSGNVNLPPRQDWRRDIEVLETWHRHSNSTMAGLRKVEYVMSQKGAPQVLLDGYLYAKNKDKGDTVYWRCVNRSCSGKCTTVTDFVKITTQHSHPPSDDRALKFVSTLRKRAREETTPMQQIYNNEVNHQEEDLLAHDDDARFPPRLWNHHGTQGPRTNNNLEGFHSRIGKTLQHRHPNVYRFIELIKNIENGEKAKVIQINFGAAPPPKKAIYKEKEQRLSRLKDQLRRGEKSPMQFLDAVGPLMMMKM